MRLVAVDERRRVGPAAVDALAVEHDAVGRRFDLHEGFVGQYFGVPVERLGAHFLALLELVAGAVEIERKSHLSAGFGECRAIEHLFHPDVHARDADLDHFIAVELGVFQAELGELDLSCAGA